jgi:hypothetical protein
MKLTVWFLARQRRLETIKLINILTETSFVMLRFCSKLKMKEIHDVTITDTHCTIKAGAQLDCFINIFEGE